MQFKHSTTLGKTMFNAENFARPESELSIDGIYVPSDADWAEFVASGDDINAYDPENYPFDDEPAAWEDDIYEDDPHDLYGADYEDNQPEWMQ